MDRPDSARSCGPPVFEWPPWALDKKNPRIEVLVDSSGEAPNVWVEAKPLKRVVDDAGCDAFLCAQYVLGGQTYTHSFAPRRVRRIGGKLTAEERHRQACAVDAAFDALHAMYGFSDTQSECGSIVSAIPGGIDLSMCSMKEAEKMHDRHSDPLGDPCDASRKTKPAYQNIYMARSLEAETTDTTSYRSSTSEVSHEDVPGSAFSSAMPTRSEKEIGNHISDALEASYGDLLSDTLRMIRQPKVVDENPSGHHQSCGLETPFTEAQENRLPGDFQAGDVRTEHISMPVSEKAKMECFRDLDRSMKGGSLLLVAQRRCYRLDTSSSDNNSPGVSNRAVSEAAFQRLKDAIQNEFCAQTTGAAAAPSTEGQGVAEFVVKTPHILNELSLRIATHMGVTPGAEVVMRTRMSPALWQPIYLLCIGAGQARVVTQAFVGEPVLGDRPDCKRSPFVIRIVTEDLVSHTIDWCTLPIAVHYTICPAYGAKSMIEYVVEHQEELFSATASGNWLKLTQTRIDSTKKHNPDMAKPLGAERWSERRLADSTQEDPLGSTFPMLRPMSAETKPVNSGHPVQMMRPFRSRSSDVKHMQFDPLGDTVYMVRPTLAENDSNTHRSDA